NLLHSGFVRQVDGFRDSATKERLGGRHHTNMTVRMDKAFPLLTTFISTIKHRQMFRFKEGSTLHRHCSAYKIIGGFYLLFCKSKRFQQAPFKIEVLF